MTASNTFVIYLTVQKSDVIRVRFCHTLIYHYTEEQC